MIDSNYTTGDFVLETDNFNKEIIQQTPDVNLGTFENFWSRKRFDEAISKKGYLVEVESALKCPCAEKSNGSPLSECLNCGGTGWFFVNKIQTKIAAMSFVGNTPKTENWDETTDSTCKLVYRPEDKLGFMDKITFLELEAWFNQILFFSEIDTDELKNSFKDIDKLKAFQKGKGLKRVFWAFTSYEPVTIFELYLFVSATEPLKILKKDIDYIVVDNKIFLQLSEKEISSDILNNFESIGISVRYSHKPVYHVISINRDLIKQKTDPAFCGSDKSKNSYENFPLSAVARKANYILDARNLNGRRIFDNSVSKEDFVNKDYNSKIQQDLMNQKTNIKNQSQSDFNF